MTELRQVRVAARILLTFAATSFVATAVAAIRHYDVAYRIELDPDDGAAHVTIAIDQQRSLLKRLTFTIDPDRYQDFRADGELTVDAGRVTWQVPARGGELRYVHRIDHRRAGGGFDARITEDWAIFKGEKLIPPVSTRALRGAQSRATLEFSGPNGWLFQSRYGRHHEPIAFDGERSFDRPTGWMIAGRLASRRENIAGRYVMVAGPSGQGVRHNDLLAFLNWNLPALVDVLPEFPDRLLIVAAAGEMWRGGLSGAGSLFVHGDRPFISQNGTSTIVHELTHVGSRLSAKDGGDWIVEGLAEYYALEIPRRTGTISERRRQLAVEQLRGWSESAPKCLRTDRSQGPNTAHAVLVLIDLDSEIRAATNGEQSLDDVMRAVSVRRDPLSPERFARIVAKIEGTPSNVLRAALRCDVSPDRDQ